MQRPGRRRLRAAALALILPLLGAAPEEPAEDAPPPPLPQSRRILMISETCDPETPDPAIHRRCVLRSLLQGDRLLVLDPLENEVYEPFYESDEVAFRTQNDFAGLPAFIRGVWDEENDTVLILGIHEPPPEARERIVGEVAP